MNFERGTGNPYQTLGVGAIANAPDITGVEYMDGSIGAMWYNTLQGSQIIQLLSFLCTTTLRVRHYYSKINELHFVTNKGTLRIWNIQGKLVKFDGKLYHIKEKLDLE